MEHKIGNTETAEGFLKWLRAQVYSKYPSGHRYSPAMQHEWYERDENSEISTNSVLHPATYYLERAGSYNRDIVIPKEAYEALDAAWIHDNYHRFVGVWGLKRILQTVLSVDGYNAINDRLAHEETVAQRTREISAYAKAMDDLMGELQRLNTVYGLYIDTPAEQWKAVAVMNQLKNQALAKLPKEA